MIVKKQQDPNAGCIPACALEVMSRLGPGSSLPTEADIIRAMQTNDGSGFARLRGAVASLTSTFLVEVHESSPQISEVSIAANAGALPLVCIDNHKAATGNSGPMAHCLIVESHDPIQGTWVVLDPWPEHADRGFIPDDRFRTVWCNGFAVIELAVRRKSELGEPDGRLK